MEKKMDIGRRDYMGNRVFSLDEIRMTASQVARKYGVCKLHLFGSYARGEATADSDLDFYIEEKGNLQNLFQLSGFIIDLEENFGCHVDVLSGKIQDRVLYENILKDKVQIYER